MAATEEFSFPTTTDTPPRFLESPPLWHRSSSTSTSSRHEPRQRKAPKGDDHHHNHRKSFSYLERGKNEDEDEDHDDGDEEEEKMDVLWEDFMNEEVSKSTLEFINISPGRGPNNIGCVKAIKLSKSGGATTAAGFSGKKPSVVVFVKLLKKLFLLQNSKRPIKKRSR